MYNLRGGINAWQGLRASGQEEAGLSQITGEEEPAEILILAYGLEEGLRGFYETLSQKQDHEALNRLLLKLARIEEAHKSKVFGMYLDNTQNDISKEAFESKLERDLMEGGFTPESFYEQHRAALQTVEGVLDVAMMLETQALDLYLRYSQHLRDEKTKKSVLKIADQEKAHLAALGRLMEEGREENV